MFGDPSSATQRLLDTSIAPPGSGKTGSVTSAQLREDNVLQFEYTVVFSDDAAWPGPKTIKNVACVAYKPRTGELFTLTVLAPEAAWDSEAPLLRAIASSFELLGP